MVRPSNRFVIPAQVGEGFLYKVPKQYRPASDTPLGLGLSIPSFERPIQAFPFAAGPSQTSGKPSFFDYGTAPTGPSFTQSEGSQKALDFLRQQTGKNIQLKPILNSDGRGLGYFTPKSTEGGLFNPPERSRDRTINLIPSAGYQTLFHEVGHARDPQLRAGFAKETSFNPAVISQLENPADRLDYLYSTKIQPRVNAETEAQAYSGFQLPRFAGANPELNIQYQKTFDDPWFKEYPASFAEKGIQQFYGGEAPGASFRVTDPDESTKVATQVIKPVDVGQRVLGLALNPDVQRKQKQIIEATRSYVDERLNPYQTSPTPAADPYWSFSR